MADKPETKADISKLTIPLVKLLMCPPDYLDTKVLNNQWMVDMAKKDKSSVVINKDKAMAQFKNMYMLFTDSALVYLIPPKPGLQDQIYVSSAGVILVHLPDKVAITPTFKANGRYGEEQEDTNFLTDLGYSCDKSPFFFEGEAELKWLRDNIYIGGYGQRSDERTYDWMAAKYDMDIIKLEETDPLMYHLDCNVFPLDGTHVMVGTQITLPADVKKISKVAEIIPVDKVSSYVGICNSVRLGYTVYNMSAIDEFKMGTVDYDNEKHKNEALEKICSDLGLECIFVNLSEIAKSGAAMSCCVMHFTFDTDRIKLGALPARI